LKLFSIRSAFKATPLTEGRGEDFSVDVVMESKGMVTSDGWTVEVASRSNRFATPPAKASFGARTSFVALSDSTTSSIRGCLFAQRREHAWPGGHLTGFEGISTERTLEVIPSLTISETGRQVRSYGVYPGTPAALVDPGRIVNEPAKLDAGRHGKIWIDANSDAGSCRQS
jgi:hypothetical protein